MAFRIKKTRLKSVDWDFGEGKKTYYYRESDKKYFQKKMLGEDDAIELAINKQYARERKK